MDMHQDKGPGERAEPEAGKAPQPASSAPAAGQAQPQRDDGSPDSGHAGKAAGINALPMVIAPKLVGDDAAEQPDIDADYMDFDFTSTRGDDAESIMVDDAPEQPAPAAPQPRSFRFALLAAAIAIAAGAGSFLGSVTASGLAHNSTAAVAVPKTADARDVLQALRTQVAALTALKANLESLTRNANSQFVKVSERLDALQRAQADPTATLARIAEAVDHLEKHAAAAPDITGSIASNPPPAAQTPAPATVSAPIVSGWIVEDVHNGRALVVSRYGGEFLVGSGSTLPGLGRVEAVKRQDGQWVVVTASGVISSARN